MLHPRLPFAFCAASVHCCLTFTQPVLRAPAYLLRRAQRSCKTFSSCFPAPGLHHLTPKPQPPSRVTLSSSLSSTHALGSAAGPQHCRSHGPVSAVSPPPRVAQCQRRPGCGAGRGLVQRLTSGAGRTPPPGAAESSRGRREQHARRAWPPLSSAEHPKLPAQLLPQGS